MFIHTSIRTSNMNRSIDFYTRFLDLVLVNRREISQNDAEIAFLKNRGGSGCTLELTFYNAQKNFVQAEYENRIFDHIAFEVEDLKGIVDQMKKERVVVTDDPFKLSPKGPLIAFVEDPDGILVELIQKD